MKTAQKQHLLKAIENDNTPTPAQKKELNRLLSMLPPFPPETKTEKKARKVCAQANQFFTGKLTLAKIKKVDAILRQQYACGFVSSKIEALGNEYGFDWTTK